MLFLIIAGNFILTSKIRTCSRTLTTFSQELRDARFLTNAQVAQLTANEAASSGAIDAPVTMVIFSDFQCPYCHTLAKTVNQLNSRDGSQFRVVFRHLPLSIHPYAKSESELSVRVERQSVPAFWALHDYFFGTVATDLDQTQVGTHFIETRIDIDPKALDACMEQHQGADQVNRDTNLANRLGISSTPTLFVNGTRVVGEGRRADRLLDLIKHKASHQD